MNMILRADCQDINDNTRMSLVSYSLSFALTWEFYLRLFLMRAGVSRSKYFFFFFFFLHFSGQNLRRSRAFFLFFFLYYFTESIFISLVSG